MSHDRDAYYARHICEPCRGERRPDDPRFRMLPDHARCQGAVEFCECWTEVLMEAEETP